MVADKINSGCELLREVRWTTDVPLVVGVDQCPSSTQAMNIVDADQVELQSVEQGRGTGREHMKQL
jgi:hypothetical protein